MAITTKHVPPEQINQYINELNKKEIVLTSRGKGLFPAGMRLVNQMNKGKWTIYLENPDVSNPALWESNIVLLASGPLEIKALLDIGLIRFE